MFSDYPTSAIVIIVLLVLACLVLAFFVCRYYKMYDHYLDRFIEEGNKAERRRSKILTLEEKLEEK